MTTQPGSRVSTMKHQADHGFSRGQPIVLVGDMYVLATAATGFNGVCGTIPDVNRFELVTSGELDGLALLIAGAVSYLSSTPGVYATTGIIPVLLANTTKTAWVQSPQVAATSADTQAAALIAAAIAEHVAAANPHSQYILASAAEAIVAAIIAGLPRDTRYVYTTPYAVLDVDDGELVWDVELQEQVLDPVHA